MEILALAMVIFRRHLKVPLLRTCNPTVRAFLSHYRMFCIFAMQEAIDGGNRRGNALGLGTGNSECSQVVQAGLSEDL